MIIAFNADAQDYQTSNVQYLSLLHNPALVALNNEVEASVSYRSQWKKANAAFKTLGASFSSTLQPKRRQGKGYLATGVNLYKQQVNNLASTLSISLSTAYHLKLTKTSTLSMGIQLGYFGKQLNAEDGMWEVQHNGFEYDPSISSGENFNRANTGGFDSGAGMVYTFKKRKVNLLQLGFAMYHLNKTKTSFLQNGRSRLPIRTSVFGSFSIPIGKKGAYIETKVIYQNQNKFSSLIIGAIAKIKLSEKAKTTSSISKLNEFYAGFGVYVRNKDAAIFNVLLQKSNWTAAFSYDLTTSSFKQANYGQGAVEIQLWYTIPSFQRKSHF